MPKNRSMSSGRTDSQERSLAQAIQLRCNESEILELIEGTDVNITDQYGKPALFYAIQCSYKNVVDALIEAGADVNIVDKEGKTALFFAIHSCNHKNAIAALVAAGADVDKTYWHGQMLLIYAIRQRNSELTAVQALIDAGVDVNITDEGGNTALLYAVKERNNKRLVQALIDAGADVDKTDRDGKTAIFHALEKRNSESVVQVLIDAGADVNTVDSRDGRTPLLYAIKKDDCESLVLSLISAGANVNALSSYRHTALSEAVQRYDKQSIAIALIRAGAEVNQRISNSSTALFFAANQVGNESVVRALIDAGADVNITNDDGQSPLFYAVSGGSNQDNIYTLIEAGAEVNLVDKHGETPFFRAMTRENADNESTVLTLIGRGANVNVTKNGKTALLWAIERRHKESVVRAMLKAGASADVNKTDSANKTPLYNAICYHNSNIGVISALIDAGADVNLTYEGGSTVLLRAIEKNNAADVVRKLVDAGARVNQTDHEGRTVLFHAVLHQSDHVVQMLVDAGANIKISDNHGKTVLFYVNESYAGDEDKRKIARVLIDFGVEVNKRDNSGKTALLYAAQSSNDSLVRTLIEAGADVHDTDSDGQTALHHAVQQSANEKVVRALIDAGAAVNTKDRYGYPALFHAVQQTKNENIVKALIGARADVNVILDDGQTPLFLAAQQVKNEGVVQALIEAGSNVSITDKYGRTALFYSVQTHSYDTGVLRALIEANDDILTVKDIYGRTAIFYINLRPQETACYLVGKNTECLRLKDNCNVDILTFAIENWISQTGQIYDAIKNGVLQIFTKKGIIRRESLAKAIINIMFRKYVSEVLHSPQHDVSHKFEDLSRSYQETLDYDVWERTSKMEELMVVLKEDFRNASKALQLLVELGADPDSADSQGNTALHLTAGSPFLGASEETVMDLCERLRKYEVRFNARNHQNQTPLLFCISQIPENKLQSAIKTSVRVCRFLVKNGSNIEQASRNEETVFHGIINVFQWSLQLHDKAEREEAMNYSIEFLELFVSAKGASATVNKTDVYLKSPLHLWASLELTSPQDYPIQLTDKHTFQSILKLILDSLIKCGARVNARNDNDETPLHLCKTWSAVKMMIDVGANVSDVDSSGRTALLAAAKKKLFLEHPDCFYPDISEEPKSFWKSALEMRIDPFTTDKQGESVIGILVASENYILAKSLIDVMMCKEYCIESGKVLSVLNAICKDKSTKTLWKTGLVQDILKSNKSVVSAPTALHFCCENAVETTTIAEQEKAIPMEVGVDESDDDSPSPKWRRVDRKVEEVDPDASTVHLENIKILRLYGAANDEVCKDVAVKHPSLKRFLTCKLNVDEIPKLIPWTSVSKRHEDKLAKVCRRQHNVIAEQYWYHEDAVGTGSFGSIFVGINVKDGREVAMKRIERPRMQRPEDKREIESLTTLAHCEQVVRYLNFFEDKVFSYIVLELMEGNLEEYFSDVSAFNPKKGTDLCQDVVKGLKHLHENGILHRDLKPQNILYKTHPKLCLKIADFGLSRRSDSTSTTVYGTNAGTRCWIAPEFLKGSNDHSKASDMFSCGLLLHFILSVRKHPFWPADSATKNPMELAMDTEANIKTDKREGWDNSLSGEATHLIEWMLESNEKERATAEEALKHPFSYSRKKKIDFLGAVANQEEFGRSSMTHPLTTDFERKASTIYGYGCWNDSSYLHMPAIFAEMTKSKKFRSRYRTSSSVDVVRFVRNAYQHVSDAKRPASIRKMLLEDFVFLEYFPDLVIEVYKAVTTHGWDQSREEIKYVMKN